MSEIFAEVDANGRICLEWLGAGRVLLEDPLQSTYMWPLKHECLSIMAQGSKNKCYQKLKQKLHPWESQACQRIYSHASNWHSNCGGSSVQFSCSVVSDSLWPHESQHARPPCPSPTPGVRSNSCPSSRWCHPAISSSVVPFSSCPQSLPASGTFPMSQLFAWGGQSIGVSASASVLPMNTQDWSPLGWTGWISLQSKGLSRVFSNTTVQNHQFFGAQLSSQSNSHIHTWPLEKP